MNFLPIAERELRVAARKRATFWVRLIAALTTLVIAFSMLLIFSQIGGPMSNKGKILFNTLAWMAFTYALAAGVFLTADSLSEEKREGTLGLLFLTDLHGYDVILGKLAATSLHAFYAIVAAFPIMALGLMLGGLLANEFWKGILAILNMLFVSLAAGMLASAICRHALVAMNAAVVLLGLLVGFPYLVDLGLAHWDENRFVLRGGVAATLHPFLIATGTVGGSFWPSLLLSHAAGWLCLALAAWRVRRSWQEEPVKVRRKGRRALRAADEAARRTADPILWLASHSQRLRPWMLLPIFGVVLLASIFLEPRSTRLTITMGAVSLLGLLLTLWMTAYATRFIMEAVRTGAFELFLCAPLSVREIIRGQWRAFIRMFAAPLVLLVVAEQLLTIIQWFRFGDGVGLFTVVDRISSVITWFTTAAAVAWWGMWMGLRSRKAHIAVLKTFVFIIVIPTIVVSIVLMILAGLLFGTGGFVLASSISSLFWMAKDALFILWARRNLYLHFREAVAGEPLRGRSTNLVEFIRSLRLRNAQT